MSIYQTKVINIGDEAELFKGEKMMILFGENAPEDLAEYCYNINVNDINGSIEPGLTLQIGQDSYQITAVGDVVEKNLRDLGHITIRFNGSTDAELGGTLYVEDKELPSLSVGTEITIG
ncbi:PTS glucitol/sorbitol transporter subunit IIA [Hutsoniella sourekii]